MGKIFSFLYDFWCGFVWGTVRLPDGRGVFFPWRTTTAYIVPTDEMYDSIRRRMVAWKIVFFFIGFMIGPIVGMILLEHFGICKISQVSFWGLIILCLAPIIFFYMRWAKRIVRNLELFTGQDLDTQHPPSYWEGQKRYAVLRSMFFYICAAISSLCLAVMGAIWLSITYGQWSTNPTDAFWGFVCFFVAIGGLIVCIIHMRLKMKMPNQDFFK